MGRSYRPAVVELAADLTAVGQLLRADRLQPAADLLDGCTCAGAAPGDSSGAPVPVTVEVDGDETAFLDAPLAARTAIADAYRELLRDPLP